MEGLWSTTAAITLKNSQEYKIFIDFWMGDCCSRMPNRKFHPIFHASLTDLYDQYTAIVLYTRSEALFASKTSRLQQGIQTYLRLLSEDSNINEQTIDGDKDLHAIHMVHKLHPLDYCTQVVTKEWLMAACLRQHRFLSDFPIKQATFQLCFRHYVEFLYLCFVSEGEVIVPSKMADFLWHSHMQDPEGYRNDLQRMLGRVLDHVDDFSEEELQTHTMRTDEIRTKLRNFMEKHAVILPKHPMGSGEDGVALYGTCAINGRGMCGAGESGLALPSKLWRHGGANCGANCGTGGGGACGGVCGGAHCGS